MLYFKNLFCYLNLGLHICPSKNGIMDISKILSISGRPGLWEMKVQTRGGIVAESLLDGKKIPVNIKHNISILGEIAIYTYTEEVPLSEVFQKIGVKENFKQSISPKSTKNELTSYFREILPNFDEDRVYTSDIKKVIQWYNLLVDKGFTSFEKNKEEKDLLKATEDKVED